MRFIKISLVLIMIIGGYFLTSFIIGKEKFINLKLLISYEQRQLIKKYIFPYKLISEQQQKILNLNESFFSLNGMSQCMIFQECK